MQDDTPNDLDALFDAYNPKLSEGGGPPREIPTRRVTFEVAPDYCRPDTFTKPFKLTLREASPAIEMEAAALSGGEGIQMGYILAKRSIEKFNGKPISSVKRDFLWKVLTTQGRGLIAEMYGSLARVSPEAEGKAHASRTLE